MCKHEKVLSFIHDKRNMNWKYTGIPLSPDLPQKVSRSSPTCSDNEAVEDQTPLKGIQNNTVPIERNLAASGKTTCAFYLFTQPFHYEESIPKLDWKNTKWWTKLCIVALFICSSKKMETIKFLSIRNWLNKMSTKWNTVQL